MGWSKEKNQSYKPRQGGTNKNLKNYTPEQFEHMKQANEEIFHILGYVKTEDEQNLTPFIDYKGKAKTENIQKINYYKKLNEINWAKRMKIRHGQLPKEKVVLKDGSKGSFRLIS